MVVVHSVRTTISVGAMIATATLLAACAPAEPPGPEPVDPSEAQGIQPPPGITLTDNECLVGGWRLSDDALQDYVLSFEPGSSIETSGQLTLSFTLDRFHVEPRVGVLWQHRGDESLASFVGEAEGQYTLTDGIMAVVEDRNDLELVDVDEGERSRVAELFLYPLGVNPLRDAQVRCSGDTLVLSSEPGATGVELAFDRSR